MPSLVVAGFLAVGCGSTRSEGEDWSASGLPDGATSGATTGSPDEPSADSEAIFDVANGQGSAGDDTSGCQKVDFLFVIDNSGSMADDQQRMIAQFPDFIDAIQNDIGIEDYRVMVVDTDWGGNAKCTDDPACFEYLDMIGSNADNSDCHEAVVETPCGADPVDLDDRVECDWLLGAGVTFPLGDEATNAPCEFSTGQRWFDSSEPDPYAAFGCAAKVGAGGSGVEHQIDSLHLALSPEYLGPGGCNEGFVRDDAILVVTFLTDEGSWWAEWKRKELHDPVRERVLEIKGGNEEAIVMFGLLDDSFKRKWLEPSICLGSSEAAGDDIRDFVMEFEHGGWRSLCEPNWGALFADALQLIEASCESFEPPG